MKPITDIEQIQSLAAGSIKSRPPCALLLHGVPVEYTPGKSITHVFEVKEMYSNVVGSMQGGLITAAFDNVFGHLAYILANGSEIATLDILTSYHRPIYPGDELKITVELKSLGKTIMYMTGEAFNKAGELIASASSHGVILKKKAITATNESVRGNTP